MTNLLDWLIDTHKICSEKRVFCVFIKIRAFHVSGIIHLVAFQF
jgi:hypothetical protein